MSQIWDIIEKLIKTKERLFLNILNWKKIYYSNSLKLLDVYCMSESVE